MKLAAILVIIAFCVGCDDFDNNADNRSLFENACSSTDPLEDVEWLQELKGSLTMYDVIVEGQYLSERVFYVTKMCANCLFSYIPPPTLYDCSGTVVRKFTDSGMDQDDLKMIKFERILYSCC